MKKSSWILTGFFNEEDTTLRIFHLNYGSNKIGRSLSNDIVIDNETVSKYHCILWIESNDLPMIKDVGSKNGTLVQGLTLEAVEDYILKENDKISLSGCQGGALFEICMDDTSSELSNILRKKEKIVPEADETTKALAFEKSRTNGQTVTKSIRTHINIKKEDSKSHAYENISKLGCLDAEVLSRFQRLLKTNKADQVNDTLLNAHLYDEINRNQYFSTHKTVMDSAVQSLVQNKEVSKCDKRKMMSCIVNIAKINLTELENATGDYTIAHNNVQECASASSSKNHGVKSKHQDLNVIEFKKKKLM